MKAKYNFVCTILTTMQTCNNVCKRTIQRCLRYVYILIIKNSNEQVKISITEIKNDPKKLPKIVKIFFTYNSHLLLQISQAGLLKYFFLLLQNAFSSCSMWEVKITMTRCSYNKFLENSRISTRNEWGQSKITAMEELLATCRLQWRYRISAAVHFFKFVKRN